MTQNTIKTVPIHIRIATVHDAAALLALYAPYVEKTAVTFELKTPNVEEFRQRIATTLQHYPYILAETSNDTQPYPRIVGYAYASPFKERAAYNWAVETSVYVHQDMRRCGIGRLLYGALEQALLAQGILNMNACIARTPQEDEYLTHASEHFHESLGFRLVGIFHQCGYKFGRWYDIAWMEKHLEKHHANQPPIRPFGEVAASLFVSA